MRATSPLTSTWDCLGRLLLLGALLSWLCPSAARAASATTAFTDSSGNAVGQYTLGSDKVFVTVTDPDQSTSSVTLTYVKVNRAGGDVEQNLVLPVTGTAHVYRGPAGGLSTRFADPATANDGTIEANNFDTIEAEYIDPQNGSEISFATATVAVTRTAPTIKFTQSDFATKSFVYVMGLDSIRVDLVSPDSNNDAAVNDQVNVTVTDSGGDTETLTLNETGANTGIFTGTLALSQGAPNSGDHILESQDGNTITVSFSDTRYTPNLSASDTVKAQAHTIGTVKFCDSSGVTKSLFSIGSEKVFVEVTDQDQVTNPNIQQTVNATITDASTGDVEIVACNETAAGSGVFLSQGLNSNRNAVVTNDGTLETQPGDTIKVVYNDLRFAGETASSTALTRLTPTAASIIFCDINGNQQFSYTIGQAPVFIQVTDGDRNLNPNVAETIPVTLTNPSTGDQENLTLTETGVNTGVFRSSGVPTVRSFTGVKNDGQLQAFDGNLVQAAYTDPGDATDSVSILATIHDFTASTTKFCDVNGNTKTSFTIGQDLTFVQVTDLDRNLDPNVAEQLSATIVVASTGDTETTTLVETGVNTGIFRTTIPLASIIAAPVSGDGQLEVTGNTSATVTYTDPHDPTDVTRATATYTPKLTAATVQFLDSGGNPVTSYHIATDLIFVRVTDADNNTDATTRQTVQVNLIDNRTGDLETVTVTETGVNTGIFQSTVGLPSSFGAPVNNDGIVETSNGSVLSANYVDALDPTDRVTAFANMVINPTLSSTAFTDASGNAKSTFDIGANDIFITVSDFDQNTDPNSKQTVTVVLKDAVTNDSENVILTETGNNTGVFRNLVGFKSDLFRGGTVTQNNGSLTCNDGDGATVSYTDTTNPPDTSSAAALMRFITASTTTFTDVNGTAKHTFVIGVDPIFVTVSDPDRGSTTAPPPTVKTVQATVQDQTTLDAEVITLTEVPTAIGTFRNTVGLTSTIGIANGSDGNLEAAGNSTLKASYADPVDNTDSSSDTASTKTAPTTATIFFTDSTGVTVTTFQIGQPQLFVTLTDMDQNLNAAVTDHVNVTLIDGSTGDVETLLLTEIDPITGNPATNTGVFRNLVAFPSKIGLAAPDGTLETADGAVVSANFTDAINFEQQVAFTTAKLVPSCSPSRSLVFTDATGNATTSYPIGDPGHLIFLTLHDADANKNAAVQDTVTVTVREDPDVGDRFVMVLSEVDPVTGQPATNTGVFRNQTGLLSTLSAVPILTNNVFECTGGEFITADYNNAPCVTVTANDAQMEIAPSSATIAFKDVLGNNKSIYTIGLEPIVIQLSEPDENKNPSVAETVNVTLASSITGDSRAIVLTETGPNTGVFNNITQPVTTTVDSVPGTLDGAFHTAGGAIVTASFEDPADLSDPQDASEPIASTVATMAIEESPATQIAFLPFVGSSSTTATYSAFGSNNTAFVRLDERDKNQNPLVSESVTITVVATNSPNDVESLVLTEVDPATGLAAPNTGVFESTQGISVTIAPPSSNDGKLETFDGGGLVATYQDPLNPGDKISAVTIVSEGSTPLTTMFFCNSSGVTKTSFVAGTDLIFVTVEDLDQNHKPTVKETLNVTLSSAVTGDQVVVTLTETGPSTGIFRNTVGVPLAIAPANLADSTLQAAGDTPIRADYTDPQHPGDTGFTTATAKVHPSTGIVQLTDIFGNARTKFVIGVDNVFVTVQDSDENKNPLVIETVPVTLTTDLGDQLVLTLTETGVNTGIFRNGLGIPIQIAPVNTGDAILQVAANNNIIATYVDPSDPSDPNSIYKAKAVIPPTPAQILLTTSVTSTTPATVFIIGVDQIFVRVIDPDVNLDPTKIETVKVSFSELISGVRGTTDAEVVTLTESDGVTGVPSPNSGVFITQTGLPLKVDLPSPADGILEVTNNTTFTGLYIDPYDVTDQVHASALAKTRLTTPGEISFRFTDIAGTKVSTYTIGATTGVFATVVDKQEDQSASVQDTVITSVFDPHTGDVVSLTLFEIPDNRGAYNTGIFRNSPNLPSEVGLPPTLPSTSLFTADEDLIIGSYLKPELGPGPTLNPTPSFDPIIQKILTRKGPAGTSCYDCHLDTATGGDSAAAGLLDITGYREFIRGGVSGSPIVTGNDVASLIIQKIATPSGSQPTLPHGNPPGVGDPTLREGTLISSADVATLRAWIDSTDARQAPPTEPVSITYTQLQAQVLTPDCAVSGCHDFPTQAGGIRLDNLAGFLQAAGPPKNAVVFGNGSASLMIRTLVDPTLRHRNPSPVGPVVGQKPGDPGYGIVTSQSQFILDVQRLAAYISQQYPNPPAGPPPPRVQLREYTGDVQPVFDRSCTLSGCHTPKDKAGGLDLTRIEAFKMGGAQGAEFFPADVPSSATSTAVPRSRLLSKVNPTLDPVHAALVPASFFTSVGPVALTSWVYQGGVLGAGGFTIGPPSNATTDTATMRVGPTTATIAFTDLNGAPVAFYKIQDDGIYVTVKDADRNLDPTINETLTVTLTDGRTGDVEPLTLTETGGGTGVFRNSTAMTSVVGVRKPDGIIETQNNSVLTASYADTLFPETVSTTITMSTNTPGRVAFVDPVTFLPLGTVFIGNSVVMQVTDLDQAGTGSLPAGSVVVTASPTGDKESKSTPMTFTENVTIPGTFRSSPILLFASKTATQENGRFEVLHGGTLNATYTDPTFSTDTQTASALVRVKPTPAVVQFVNSSGAQQTSYQVNVQDLFVRVIDADRNLDPTVGETLTVDIVNPQNADDETIVCQEIGTNSGIFQNTVGVSTSLAPAPLVGNGVVEVTDTGVNNQQVRATYVDSISPETVTTTTNIVVHTPATVAFTGVTGNVVTQYVRGQDLIFVTVTDADRNRNKSVVESIIATVFDDVSGDHETLTLVETGVNTGVFRNAGGLRSVFAFPLPATPEDHLLESRVNTAGVGSICSGPLLPTVPLRVVYSDPAPLGPTDTVSATAGLVPKNPLDSDDDGIPDSWECAHGMNPLDPTDARLDFDGDGASNLQEYLEGTDPLNPFDHKPVARAGANLATDPTRVQLNGAASTDPREKPLTYTWTQLNVGVPGHGPAVTLSNVHAIAPTFIGQTAGLYDFSLVVSNNGDDIVEIVPSNPSVVTVTVNNVAPSPFAGLDQTVSTADLVTLDGLETLDANGDPVTFAWSSVPIIAIGSSNTPQASVGPLPVGTYTITLAASDPALNLGTSEVHLVVDATGDHVPLASVKSPVSGNLNAAITLDGSASADADVGDTLTYHWQVTKAPIGVTPLVIPSDSTSPQTSFIGPRTGMYEVTLTVTDPAGNRSLPARVSIAVDFPGSGTLPPDNVPVADPGGDQSIPLGGSVTLDGRTSRDPEGSALTYQWTQTGGTHVALANATSAQATFFPLNTGLYTFTLVVNDGRNDSPTATVHVTVFTSTDHVPVANAGPTQVVFINPSPATATVTLDGSQSSDADGGGLTYYWTQLAGPGVPLAFRNAARPSFAATRAGTYQWQLVVFDGKHHSLPSTTSVQVVPAGAQPPTANAGPSQIVYVNNGSVTVTLDGRASSSPQGLPLTFFWSQTAGPPVVLTPTSGASTPSFTASAPGVYQFSLTVTDSQGLSSLPSTVSITVENAAGSPPVININGQGGQPVITAAPEQTVTLDASQTFSRAALALTYGWSEISGPPVLLASPASARVSFIPQMGGTYIFQLTVLDSAGNSSSANATVLVGGVSAAPGVGAGTLAGSLGGGSSGGTGASGGSGGGGGGGCRATDGGRAGSSPVLPLLALATLLCLIRRSRRRA